jgi:endonuclease/exonuclease/phosphatase family metal-dependent hydrolase
VGHFAYEGSSGLLLLSKHPFSKTQSLSFFEDSTSNFRAALLADLKVNKKTFSVACTHLTADLQMVAPYTGKHGGWQVENKIQMEQLISALEQNTVHTQEEGSSNPLFLMGDFNCSFADFSEGSDIEQEVEESCQIPLDKGFMDPFLSRSPLCSFCQNNSHNRRSPHSVLIDHIFVKNMAEKMMLSSKRVFDQKVKLPLSSSDESMSWQNLSDHYGVELNVDWGN